MKDFYGAVYNYFEENTHYQFILTSAPWSIYNNTEFSISQA